MVHTWSNNSEERERWLHDRSTGIHLKYCVLCLIMTVERSCAHLNQKVVRKALRPGFYNTLRKCFTCLHKLTGVHMTSLRTGWFALRGQSHNFKLWGLLCHSDLALEVLPDWCMKKGPVNDLNKRQNSGLFGQNGAINNTGCIVCWIIHSVYWANHIQTHPGSQPLSPSCL